jgi:hypothetical protein
MSSARSSGTHGTSTLRPPRHRRRKDAMGETVAFAGIEQRQLVIRTKTWDSISCTESVVLIILIIFTSSMLFTFYHKCSRDGAFWDSDYSLLWSYHMHTSFGRVFVFLQMLPLMSIQLLSLFTRRQNGPGSVRCPDHLNSPSMQVSSRPPSDNSSCGPVLLLVCGTQFT